MSYDNDDDDDDEVIIGDSDSSPNSLENTTNSWEVPHFKISIDDFLNDQIQKCNQINPIFKVRQEDSSIMFQIPTKVIPPSLQMVCEFYKSPILLNVTIRFQIPSWTDPVSKISAKHPQFDQNYSGRPLVLDTIRHFFTSQYHPKEKYRSDSFAYLLHDYENHQLLYLIYEIIECFIDLQDHCCICHSKLPFTVIKPTICSKKLCEVSYNEIGVGTSVVQEIRRDVHSADLLLSLFACSFHNKKYMNPKPPDYLMHISQSLFKSLPPMATIAKEFKRDSDFVAKYGQNFLDLLRWVLLSNKSQLIHLPDELKLDGVDFSEQFMTLIASPSAELNFQKLKKSASQKSLLLWHGSSGDRWHSIIRNGLKNMSRVDCVHGASYGEGIYLSQDVNYSLSYTQPVNNLYLNSIYSPVFQMIALCEVVKCNSLKIHDDVVCTLSNENALVVRFVFPVIDHYISNGDDEHDDGYSNSKIDQNSKLPTIYDVVSFLEQKSYEIKYSKK